MSSRSQRLGLIAPLNHLPVPPRARRNAPAHAQAEALCRRILLLLAADAKLSPAFASLPGAKFEISLDGRGGHASLVADRLHLVLSREKLVNPPANFAWEICAHLSVVADPAAPFSVTKSVYLPGRTLASLVESEAHRQFCGELTLLQHRAAHVATVAVREGVAGLGGAIAAEVEHALKAAAARRLQRRLRRLIDSPASTPPRAIP